MQLLANLAIFLSLPLVSPLVIPIPGLPDVGNIVPGLPDVGITILSPGDVASWIQPAYYASYVPSLLQSKPR
jgi:hypothetical protein